MNNKFQFNLLADHEVAEIYRASLEVLENTGVAFFDEGALRLFKENGACVDFKKEIVQFPPAMIEDIVKKGSGRYTLYNRDFSKRLDIGALNTYFVNSSYDLWILDYRTHQRRGTTLKDVEDLVVIGDAVDNYDIIGPQVVPKDVPSPLMQIKATETILKNTTKPFLIGPTNLQDAKYMLELARAVAGDEETLRKKPMITINVCGDSPLRYGKAQIDVFYEASRRGVPIHINPCPIVGMTSPVTLAGALTQTLAEWLAGIALVRLLNEDQPVALSETAFTMSPKGDLMIGSPESCLFAWASAQILRDLGFLSCIPSTFTDSKIPTMQSGYEKAMGLMIAVLSGSNIVTLPTTLDEAATTSFEQQVIESEMLNAAMRIMRGITVSPDTIATDVIQQVGPGGEFLRQMHTVKHYRSECWIPELFFKGSWRTFAEEKKTVIDNAEKKIHEILKKHHPEPLPHSTQKELETIVSKAEKDLL